MAISARSAKVWLLYAKQLKGISGRLSLNVAREICCYLINSFLAKVAPAFLRFFNVHTSAWTAKVKLTSLIQVDEGSRWMILEDGLVFCSGGECRGGQLAYLLGKAGNVYHLPYMLLARAYHGIIQIRTFIYTFGGCTFHSVNKDTHRMAGTDSTAGTC
jgi:hypothetical protein